MLRSYRRSWLPKDLVAGLILTALLVPQGMAYAELAGLPPITGLYTSILCLVGYALFGPSKILVLGPDSSLGPMIAATILPLAGADRDPARAVALASVLALLVGAMTVLAGVARLGFVADLLSKPTMIGYMNGLAATIVVGQLPKLFGFSVKGDGFVAELRGFAKGLANGETVGAAIAVGLFGLAVILLCQRWLPKIPAVLIAVVASDRALPLRLTCRTTVCQWWERCRGAFRRSRFHTSPFLTWACWWRARSASPWSHSPTPFRRRRRLRREAGRRSTVAGR